MVGRRILVGLNVAMAVMLMATSAAYAYVHWRLRRIDTVDIGEHQPEASPGEPMNILVVGSDSRAVVDPSERKRFGTEKQAGGRNTDTMLVVRIDPAQRRTAILSIPRDLYVPIAGTTREAKINSAYGGGPQRLVDTVSNALGIPVHHYVELDFNSFRAIVNALGGVDYRFATPVRDVFTGLDIRRAGCVHLDGNMALNLVRSRHHLIYRNGDWQEDARQDFGRIERQQQFMRLLMRKASSAVRNPLTLNSLLATVTDNLTVDKQLDVGEMKALASRLRDVSPDAVELLTITGPTGSVDGQSVVFIDAEAARPILERFAGGRPVMIGAVTSTTRPPRRAPSSSTTTTTLSPTTTSSTTTTTISAAC